MKQINSLIILICLILIEVSVSTIFTLSKFKTTKSFENEARVSFYAVDATQVNSETEELNIDCAGDKNIKLQDSNIYVVTNKKNDKISEVSIRYKLKVQLLEDLPVGLSINVIDSQNQSGIAYKTGNAYIYENDNWIFEAGIESSNILNVIFQGENIEGATSGKISNVQVSIITEQIE